LIALGFKWYSSMRRAEERSALLYRLLSNAEAKERLYRSLAEVRDEIVPEEGSPLEGSPSFARLDGTDLRDATISVGGMAFPRACFNECDLRDATLEGDEGSFQGAQFDNANLANVELTGGGSAFQVASFAGADLSGATLTSSGSSFQGATFAGADLSGAVITCNHASFQEVSLEGAKLIGARVASSGTSFGGVHIDGAQFQGADLSMVDRYSLDGCHFKTPPEYDEKTRFPAGFDPVHQRWTLVTGGD
jgi:uncharacterized protein YjbI with pentapeptide repeats